MHPERQLCNSRLGTVYGGEGHIGALLLGARKEGKFVYVGSVGTGIRDSEAWNLRGLMEKLTATRAPVQYAGRRKNITWLKPKLVAEIEYRAWTSDRKLRHASYKGLRDSADSDDIYQI